MRTFATLLTLALLPLAPGPAAAKDGRNAAFIGGAAAGAVGGVLLNEALQNRAAAAPVYVEPAPRYVEPVANDPELIRLRKLRRACYEGNPRTCIRLGYILGQNRERERQWRRHNPDLFDF